VHWHIARRPVARVDFGSGGSVILKWLEDSELETDNESWALTLLDGLPLPVDLKLALPRLLGTSRDGRVQAFENIDNCVTWAECAASDSPSALAILGTTLADLHGLAVSELAARHRDRHVRFPIPSMSRLTPTEYSLGYGADFAEYATMMQSLDSHLAALRDKWTTSAYIHFDLRDDNVLFGARHPSVSIVDWELAGFGEPCYDVGSVVGQLLFHRIPTLRGNDSRALARALAAADRFLTAYRSRSGADDAWILRSLQFAGVFLLLTSLGRLEKVGSLGQVGHLCLLVGRHLVQRPDACHAAMLGPRSNA